MLEKYVIDRLIEQSITIDALKKENEAIVMQANAQTKELEDALKHNEKIAQDALNQLKDIKLKMIEEKVNQNAKN